MKSKAIKIIVSVLGILIAGISILLLYVKTALPNVGPPPEIKFTSTPELVARGEYLANHVMLCMDCHGTRDYSKFSGPLVKGTEGGGGEVFDHRFGFPGSFTSKNITPFNLSSWTDGEIFRAITTGVNKDGKALFPVMPYKYYAQLDEEDIKAVIAYLRTVPSIEKTPAASQADFPINFIINTIPEEATLQKRPSSSDVLAYGKYMITAAGCMECHTRQEKGKQVGEPFAGGFAFNLGNGTVVTSPNITPHQTGIASWSKDQFIQRFKMYTDSSFVLPDVDMSKGQFQSVMPWTMYAGMKEEDLGAIYEYLQTVAPVENTVTRFSAVK